MSYFEDDEKFGPKSDDEDDESTVQSDLDEDDDEDEVVDNDVDEVLGDEEDVEDDEEDVEDDEEDAGEGKGPDDTSYNESDKENNLNENNLNENNLNENNLNKKVKKIIKKQVVNKAFIESLSDDDEDDGETYLKKFDKDINSNYIVNNHPECALQNYDDILAMTKVVRDKNNIIIDDLHRTIPHLTKYERARILGQRAKQIECGATPFIKVPENVIDGYLIAVLELNQGRIPFIIRRPMPNGGSEYWKVGDLENIAF